MRVKPLVGYRVESCQDNQSMSSYGVMRGLHFQRPQFTQSKLMRCVKGRVITSITLKMMGVMWDLRWVRKSDYDLDEPMTLDYSELDSFVILIGLKGEAKITDNEGNEITLQGGESIVVPASTKTLKVEGTLKFLETYV